LLADFSPGSELEDPAGLYHALGGTQTEPVSSFLRVIL
jgi:hypothetical protein